MQELPTSSRPVKDGCSPESLADEELITIFEFPVSICRSILVSLDSHHFLHVLLKASKLDSIIPADLNIPDNYVEQLSKRQRLSLLSDTDLDPYNAHKGFFYSHIGWMLIKHRRKPGIADVSDLIKNPVIKWQHKYYLPMILIAAFAIPTIIPLLFWNDPLGGYVYAGVGRLCFVHHVSNGTFVYWHLD